MPVDQLMANHQSCREYIKHFWPEGLGSITYQLRVAPKHRPDSNRFKFGERIIQEPRHHYYMPINHWGRDRQRAYHPTVTSCGILSAAVPRPYPIALIG